MEQTPLQNKIDELRLKYNIDLWDGDTPELLQELAQWVVETVMPDQEKLEDDLYEYDCYPGSKDQAEMVIDTIKSKALLAGIIEDK